MQNAAYKAADINMIYFYTESDCTHLEEIINGIRYMPSFAGCAITKPNKIKVIEYLDDVDPFCRKMGACNTIVKDSEGRLIGYNTDGPGFIRAIRAEAGFEIKGKTFFCFGAGGAGRAICSSLVYNGASRIFITDTALDAALNLSHDINSNFMQVAETVRSGEYSLVGQCDMVINASGIGMGRTIGETPLPEEWLQPGQFCFDACYNPRKTQFLLTAEVKGCRIMNGMAMSLYQGAEQIELWTGEPAPIDAMRKELIDIVSEQIQRTNDY